MFSKIWTKKFMCSYSDNIEQLKEAIANAGGFYPFDTLEEYWAWWSRHIYYNRYVDEPKPMTVNLRCDSTFVEDEGWHRASEYYAQFLRRHENSKVLYLELGVGANTPGIIKYPFWRMTEQNEKATYACINLGEAMTPQEIANRSICIDGDIDKAILTLS